MRALVKYIMGKTYRPYLVKYLSSVRTYSYKGIQLEIPPEVFHPAFFYSTKYLLGYIKHKKLNGKSLMELGAGSGLIAMYASRLNASVTASDINPVAVEYLKKNAAANEVDMEIIQSDLFEKITPAPFDFIVINPPYYKKDPVSYLDYAWFCGENGEYYHKLFSGLRLYTNESSQVIMVLCDGCDIEMIRNIALQHSYRMDCEHSRVTLVEKNYIFSIKPAS